MGEEKEVIKTIETELGKIYMLKPGRTATDQDSRRLHSLIARLLVEEFIENRQMADSATRTG